MLIFIAVYNASIELKIIHEIGNIHSIVSSRLDDNLQARHGESTLNNIEHLASVLSTDKYNVYSYSENTIFEIDDFKFTSNNINDSRVNQYGGYFTNDGNIYTWSLISVLQSEQKLLVTHLYQSASDRALFLVYKNRLIIPAAFFIWMTVWGALILSNLVKQIQLQKEEAKHMALHDALTGLANRNLFTEKLEELWQYSLRHTLSFHAVVIDLDKFKLINDTYGHDAGDELLRQVASRFKQVIRSYDFVARIGGDEFILLLPDTDNGQRNEIFDRIHNVLTEPYDVLGNTLSIGASLGVSEYPKDAENAEDAFELIHKADKAMYLAKARGSGIKIYDATTDN
jgi:diguanylate cyclase (GGDEF)-like protein